jgi:hypothetical protein
MDIRFKQPQIEAALRGYIIKQGIDLTGRTVDIVFTAGRGGNGLMVDIALSEGDFKEDVPPVRLKLEDAIEEPMVFKPQGIEVSNATVKECIVDETNEVNLNSQLPSATEGNTPRINLFG